MKKQYRFTYMLQLFITEQELKDRIVKIMYLKLSAFFTFVQDAKICDNDWFNVIRIGNTIVQISMHKLRYDFFGNFPYNNIPF